MAKPRRSASRRCILVLAVIAASLMQACGGSGSNGGGGGGGTAPSAPTNLVATAGTLQVVLTWGAGGASNSASNIVGHKTPAPTFNVLRGTTTGGPYTSIAGNLTTDTYTDTSVTAGTAYFYVVTATNAYGTSPNSNEASATPTAATPPPAPTGLSATPGNTQVVLNWTASTGATSYNVKRGTTSGAESTISSPTSATYTDTSLTNGTTYYYVVTAVSAGGESSPSSEVSAMPSGPSASVHVTVDVLANRHVISPYVYGGAFPQDVAHITDSGLSVVRWGGNGASTYNWQLGTTNADNDYYFEDFAFGALNNSADSDSAQFIQDVKTAGSLPLMTMVMLPWVAQTAETAGSGGNLHWSFPETEYPSQCSFDQYNTDAGNGIVAGTCNNSTPTYITATSADLNRTYFPLLDDHTQTCPVGTCVYRDDWAAALSTAFGSSVPHFYDMDNEIDIWGGTHRDVHPDPTTFEELRDVYLTESRNLKGWDPAAFRLGPVSCCWYYYWRSATGASDTSSHGGIDFLPWWVNEVAWSDAIAGSRSLDSFDIHAYPDADVPSTLPAKQALAVSIYRDWWDPTYPSAASYVVNGGFSNEPLDSNPFRIPRLRAIVNQAYPGTQFSMTEWSAAFAGESDFSTAIGDADAYGILGNNHVYLSTRWTAPISSNPNYLALKLYTNYDGAHHGFGTTSVSDTNDGSANLFSSYAALNSAGTTLTVMVLNKDPQNAVTAGFALNGFTPSSVAVYTLAATAPTTITKTTPAWTTNMTFAPYTVTLLVVSGTSASTPASEWDLNPDTVMVAASATVTLQPKILSGSANVTLTTSTFDSGITSVTLTESSVTTSQTGTVTVTAGNTPGFYHYTVTGTDSGASQTQGGYIVVGKPAATLTKTTGDGQSATHGTVLPQALTVTLSPASSGGTATGASILFTTSAGTLSNGTTTGSKVIAITNGSGVASVTLTLPSTTGAVSVTAEGPYGLGHPEQTFTETSN